MREKKPHVIITFYTTAEAMAAEKLCGEKKIDGRLISAPRALSADCGIAWCSAIDVKDSLLHALDEAKIEFAGCHEMMY